MFNLESLALRREVIKNNESHPIDELRQKERETKELLLDIEKNWNKFLDAIS